MQLLQVSRYANSHTLGLTSLDFDSLLGFICGPVKKHNAKHTSCVLCKQEQSKWHLIWNISRWHLFFLEVSDIICLSSFSKRFHKHRNCTVYTAWQQKATSNNARIFLWDSKDENKSQTFLSSTSVLQFWRSVQHVRAPTETEKKKIHSLSPDAEMQQNFKCKTTKALWCVFVMSHCCYFPSMH